MSVSAVSVTECNTCIPSPLLFISTLLDNNSDNSRHSPDKMHLSLIKTKVHSPFPWLVKPEVLRSLHHLWRSSHSPETWHTKELCGLSLILGSGVGGAWRWMELPNDQEGNSSALRSSHPYFPSFLSLLAHPPSISKHSKFLLMSHPPDFVFLCSCWYSFPS